MKKKYMMGALLFIVVGVVGCGQQESAKARECRLALEEREGSDVSSDANYDTWMKDCEAGQGLPK